MLFESMTLGQFLIETSEIESLKKNKIPLTDEERQTCLDNKAVWNNHPDPKKNPVPAVWKSKGKDGKMTYVTNTHRAYNKAPTLKGAIARYHDFIKGTA